MTTDQAAEHLFSVARGVFHERACRRTLGEQTAAEMRNRVQARPPANRLAQLVGEVQHQRHLSGTGEPMTRQRLALLWNAVREIHEICKCRLDVRSRRIGELVDPAATIADLESRLGEAVENLRDRSEDMLSVVAERARMTEELQRQRREDADWTYTDGGKGEGFPVHVRFDGEETALAGAPAGGTRKESELHRDFFSRLAAAAEREVRRGGRTDEGEPEEPAAAQAARGRRAGKEDAETRRS